MRKSDEIQDDRLRELRKLSYDLKYIKDLKANYVFNPPLAFAISDELTANIVSLTEHLNKTLNGILVDLKSKVSKLLQDMGHNEEEIAILLPVLEDSFYRFMYKQKEMRGE